MITKLICSPPRCNDYRHSLSYHSYSPNPSAIPIINVLSIPCRTLFGQSTNFPLKIWTQNNAKIFPVDNYYVDTLECLSLWWLFAGWDNLVPLVGVQRSPRIHDIILRITIWRQSCDVVFMESYKEWRIKRPRYVLGCALKFGVSRYGNKMRILIKFSKLLKSPN